MDYSHKVSEFKNTSKGDILIHELILKNQMHLTLNIHIKEIELMSQGLNLVLTSENEAMSDDKKETLTQATSNVIYVLLYFTSQYIVVLRTAFFSFQQVYRLVRMNNDRI